MKIKFLQLNILRGKYLPDVIKYIRRHDFDIVCLQEVAGGDLGTGSRNCFGDLVTGTGLEGQLAVYVNIAGDVSSYIGNAILYKPGWKMRVNHVLWLKRYKEVKKESLIHSRKSARQTPRCALAVVLENGGAKLMVLATHLAWGPTPDDAVYKRDQAERLAAWMTSHIRMPFILSGDFNLNPRTRIVRRLSRFGVNLTTTYGITNTLNPRTHRLKGLFPSGLAVDYVIVDKRIRVDDFSAEERVDLSDHLGLVGSFVV